MSQSPNNKTPVRQTPNSQFTFSLDTPSLSGQNLEGYLKTILGTDSVNSLPEMFTSSSEFKPLSMNTLKNLESSQPDREEVSLPSSSKESSPSEQLAPPVVVSLDKMPYSSPSSSSTSSSQNFQNTDLLQQHQQQQLQQQQHQQHQLQQHQLQQQTQPLHIQQPQRQHMILQQIGNSPDNLEQSGVVVTTENSSDIIPVPRGQSYVDITEYLNMPQSDAAKKLGIPASTLSKRWKEAVRKRKWPYRMICKIDKEIMTLLHNVPQGPNAPPLPPEIETALGHLLRKRQEELRSVVIRL